MIISKITADLLGYTSPLSISLASSDGGLSVSLRSTTELRSMQQIIQPSTSGAVSSSEQQQQQPCLQRQQSIDDSTVNQPINYKKK
jgi:hypothetical protein